MCDNPTSNRKIDEFLKSQIISRGLSFIKVAPRMSVDASPIWHVMKSPRFRQVIETKGYKGTTTEACALLYYLGR